MIVADPSGVGFGLIASAVVEEEVDDPPMAMFDPAVNPLVSCDVATAKVAFGYVPVPGFVIPGIESVPDDEPASEHPAGSVTVATLPETVSVAAGQLAPKPVKITDCPFATAKAELKATLMTFDGDSAPDPEVVKPTVHVDEVLAAVEPGANVAPDGADAEAASTETVVIRLPSTAAPTKVLANRLRCGCSTSVAFVADACNLTMLVSLLESPPEALPEMRP